MLVGKRMTKEVVTLKRGDSLQHAAQLVREKGLRTLPVMDGDRLVGVVTDRDIRRALPSDATSLEIREINYLLDRVKVSEIMTKKVITVPPESTIEEAAKILRDRKIGGLPVMDGGKLLGIITKTDILDILIEVMGVGEESSRIEVVLPHKPGALAEVASIIKGHEVNIISIVTTTHSDPEKRLAVMRLKTSHIGPILESIKRGGFEVTYTPE